MATKSITIENETLNLERIAFGDIKEGNTVAHLWENDGDSSIWIGTALDYGRTSHAWYGNGRSHAVKKSWRKDWDAITRDPRDEVIVAYEWHDDETDGHTLWLVK